MTNKTWKICIICNKKFEALKHWKKKCPECEEKRLGKCKKCGKIFQYMHPTEKFCLDCKNFSREKSRKLASGKGTLKKMLAKYVKESEKKYLALLEAKTEYMVSKQMIETMQNQIARLEEKQKKDNSFNLLKLFKSLEKEDEI